MFTHNISPVLFSIGWIEIRYYSLAYILGAVIVYFLLKKISAERGIGLGKIEIMDYVAYCLLGVILGGRLGYVLIYGLPYYLSNPLQAFAVWNGGMSFHGGLIGVFIAAYVFARKKKINFWKLADWTVIPIGIALCLGRIGNFINGEIYGRITNVAWAVKFKGADGFRHPSQLYEALKNLLIFAALYSLMGRKLPDGFLFWLFIAMYGMLRFLVEFFREPETVILGLSTGQWLCGAMIILGTAMMVRLRVKGRKVGNKTGN